LTDEPVSVSLDTSQGLNARFFCLAHDRDPKKVPLNNTPSGKTGHDIPLCDDGMAQAEASDERDD
jgi:hypothetical protein